MERSRENILARLREQADFLATSACAFYSGNFGESVRVATTIRTLVHEGSQCKPLLKQVRADGLDLQILDSAANRTHEGENVFSFAVGVGIGGAKVSPSVDLASSHYSRCSVGAWWNRAVFNFPSNGKQMVYTRKKIILILANKEGGAHVDSKVDPEYSKLLTDQPLTFQSAGGPVETPDLARFLAAQSGTEMLECLKSSFFADLDVPMRWDFGGVPPITVDQISGSVVTMLASDFPKSRIQIIRRR